MKCVGAVLTLLGLIGVGTLAAQPRAQQPGEADFRRAVELRSGALADLEQGRFGRAAERLEELATILPDNVLPAVDLAISYFALGRSEEALRQVDRALALDPDNPEALFAVTWSLRFEPAAEARWHDMTTRFIAAHPDDARPHYLQALRLRELQASEEGAASAQLSALLRAHDRDPENLMLGLLLLESALAAGDAVAAADALDAVGKRLGGFAVASEQAAKHAADLQERLGSAAFGFDFGAEGATDDALEMARPRAAVLHNLLRAHDLYRLGSQRLSGGVGGETFAMQDFLPPLPVSVQGGADPELVFVYSGSQTLGVSHLVPARRRGRDTLLAAGDSGWFEVEDLDRLRRLESSGAVEAVGSWDLSGDGETDLVWAGPEARKVVILSSWIEDPAPPSALFSLDAGGQIEGLWPLDVDHDGDLDLFTGFRYLRNDGSTWTDQAGSMGLVSEHRVTDVASADFDDDGDLDVVVIRAGTVAYLDNRRAGALVESTSSIGLANAAPSARQIELGDFDGDGRFDLIFWGRGGAELWRFHDGGFVRDQQAFQGQTTEGWQAAVVADLDNDGDLDVVIRRVRSGAGLELLRRRDGGFQAESLASEEFAGSLIHQLMAADLDDDGDLDLTALGEDGQLHLWRNDSGNENHWLRLTLVGREHNNSKNNTQGLFTRIEARVGGRLMVLSGEGGVNHVGLGSRRRADVVRVVWPNGLSQIWQHVAADQSLVEEQVLKGSCPFLYTWDGDGFRFVTDLMWRSPLGMVMADGRPAPHQSARDAVLLPPDALRPVGNELWLAVTEELWEAAYVDEQVLYAVDHPASAELVVDERILPPPYPSELPIQLVEDIVPPKGAKLYLAEESRDVRRQLAHRDEIYVGDLALTRYQGLTSGQTLELEFGDLGLGTDFAGSLRFLLWGWTFPTDTSINVALAADPMLDPYGPELEVEVDGRWQTVAPFVGFPAGKRKGMVVDLPPELETSDGLRLRLRTNLQIYWDAAALARRSDSTPRITALSPVSADLHPRGFSRLVRHSPDGPHLFDYRTVRSDSPFRPMVGAFTRFGDVSELVRAADDRYAVMAAGDEMTVVYDNTNLPPLPDGWVRRWVLFTDGWVKDADINTTASQSVGPLPYSDMEGYPDPRGHAYPDTPAHRDFLRSYQTRTVFRQKEIP
ncbi:MAG: FG-GAP-like repeat-containing protein [Thermoanaerobaculia bacterium]|nr:FG-GAP-like repeat-containing protein [Thermoanaerobaculia bacterium]